MHRHKIISHRSGGSQNQREEKREARLKKTRLAPEESSRELSRYLRVGLVEPNSASAVRRGKER